MQVEKICSDCRQNKLVSEFAKDRSRKDGLEHICKPCRTSRYSEWRSKNRARYNEKQYRHIRKFPERQRARGRIATALKRGDMTRQPCEQCGVPVAHAHHPDYSKPLEVMWLCPTHHEQMHHEK